MQIRDWIEPMLKSWARQWWAIQTGDEPAGSTLSKLIEMHENAALSVGIAGQRFDEVFKGDGLLIARALHGAPESVRTIVAAHYLARGQSAPEKALALGMSKTKYWTAVESAWHYLAGRIDQRERPSAA
jgi:hypothetical protein